MNILRKLFLMFDIEMCNMTRHEAVAFILEEHETITIRHSPAIIINTGRQGTTNVSGTASATDGDLAIRG